MYIIQMSEQMTIVMNSEIKVKSLEAFYKVSYYTFKIECHILSMHWMMKSMSVKPKGLLRNIKIAYIFIIQFKLKI